MNLLTSDAPLLSNTYALGAPLPIPHFTKPVITTMYKIHNLLIRFIHFCAYHFQSVRVFAFCVFTTARNLLAVAIVKQ